MLSRNLLASGDQCMCMHVLWVCTRKSPVCVERMDKRWSKQDDRQLSNVAKEEEFFFIMRQIPGVFVFVALQGRKQTQNTKRGLCFR
jgi:hypothetical protein